MIRKFGDKIMSNKLVISFVVAVSIFNLNASQFNLNSARASDSASTASESLEPSDDDFLKLLDSLKNYTQTTDIALASKIDSSFYLKNSKIDAALSDTATNELKKNSGNNDAINALKTSLSDANTALIAKKLSQENALKVFEEAKASAVALNEKEKAEQDLCNRALKKAISLAESIGNDCNNLSAIDEKNNCIDELNACKKKINGDFNRFGDYLNLRNTVQPSKDGSSAVQTEAVNIQNEFSVTNTFCNNKTRGMALAETNGKCIEKVTHDEKNESFQENSADTKSLGINVILDSNILIPLHRINGWDKFIKMAKVKLLETENAMTKIAEYKAKLDKFSTNTSSTNDLENNIPVSDEDKQIAIFGRGGMGDIPVGLIKKFFAGNPTPEEILTQAAKMNMSRENIAVALAIGGYNIEDPSSPLVPIDLTRSNYNAFTVATRPLVEGTKSPVETYGNFIDKYVKDKGGKFGDIEHSYGLTVPGVTTYDKYCLFSAKGIITPDQIDTFFKTAPSEQKLFAKMYDLGLTQDDLYKILRSQELIPTEKNWNGPVIRDSKGNNIFLRVTNQLYNGDTGYGVSCPSETNPYIVPNTGHITIDDKTPRIPYGFTKSCNVGGHGTPAPTKVFTPGSTLFSKKFKKK